MIEDGPFKYWLLGSVTVLGIIGILGFSCNHYHDIDARAPVVETCVKHPVTRSPFQSGAVR